MSLTQSQKIDLINAKERAYGFPLGSVLNVIIFESAGTLSTTVPNAAGSGAIGLFQFMPQYYPVQTLLKMSFEEQLDYGFKNVLGPYKTKLQNTKDQLDFYLAVLYPTLMGKPDTAVFADKRLNPTRYVQNKGLDINNDGVVTKADIRRYFYKKVDGFRVKNSLEGITVTANAGTFTMLLLMAGFLIIC